MDEIIDNALVQKLCTEVREKLSYVKKRIVALESLKENYMESNRLLSEGMDELDKAKREYVNAKEQFKTALVGNLGNKKQESLAKIIDSITKQEIHIQTEVLPDNINNIRRIESRIEYYKTQTDYVDSLSNLGQLERMSIAELEKYNRNLEQLLIELQNEKL